tara:strand:+ start:1181 stop:1999 length:819 start_codon:yes stop_codon:yes gene_type:complete
VQLPSRQPVKLGPRVDFRPEEFRKFFFKAGLDLTWEQAQECPCKRATADYTLEVSLNSTARTHEARLDCQQCKGKGYFYHSPQTVRAIVTSAAENPERFRQYGEFATGMINISLLPEHLPSYGDRFTMSDSVLLFRETKVRGFDAIEKTRFPVVTRELDLSTGSTQVGVLNLHRANADGTCTDAGALVQDVDFTVDANGDLDFTLGDANGNAPSNGTRYAVSYYAHPRFVVVDHPHAFRDTFVKTKSPTVDFRPLPIQCNARLEFLNSDRGI